MFSKSSQQPVEIVQRIQVGLQGHGPAARLKICLQNHHESLGWYTAGCLSIPLHQVPLLEQALDRVRNHQASGESVDSPRGNLRIAESIEG